MRKVYGPVLVALLCLTVGLALAAETEPLTEDKVRSFIKSIDDIHVLAKQYERSLVDMNTGEKGNHDQVFSNALSAMEGHPAYREFEAAIRRHGFTSPEQWALIGNRVMLAFVAVMSEGQRPDLDKQMAQAMAQLDQSNMSAEQKAAMSKMLESAGVAMVTMQTDVSAADKRAVRSSIDDIKAWEKLD